MSAPAAASTPTAKPKLKLAHKPTKEKEKERDKDKAPDSRDTSKEDLKPDYRLKTVVRRLPPNLPEDVFWQSVQAWVTEASVTWKVFYPGKVGKRCALLN